MKRNIIIATIVLIIILIVASLIIYINITKLQEEQENNINNSLDKLYNEDDYSNSIENEIEQQGIVDIERKNAYYDEDGFVTESLYIDCQVYCEFDEENIKSIMNSKIEEIKIKILEEQANTSGMVVINLSGNTKLHKELNVLEYNETYRRYKMLKTYFDDTFSKSIMTESNKPQDSNIFNVDLENNKNISFTNNEETIYYSVKTGQKIQNVSDLFSSNYDYSSVIKERVKYMLDLNIGYSESEVSKKVNETYDKLNIEIDLLNEKLIISLEDDGFEMSFNEFDKSQMTIY